MKIGGRTGTVWTLASVGVLSFAVALFAWTRIPADGPGFHGTAYPDSPPAPDFTLADHRGATVTLGDYRGKVVLLFFGFSRCPDVCPLTLNRLTQVLRDADIGPERVRVVLVTVDPENDSPEVLAGYIEPFGPSVDALSGPGERIAEVMAAYGVFAERREGHDGNPHLAHTSVVFGIDRAGRLQVLLHPEESAATVLQDIRTLLDIRG